MLKVKRSGDHAFKPVIKIPKGEIIKHNGTYIFGVGEASNHNHVITVANKQDLIITKAPNGGVYFNLLSDGKLSHVLGDSEKIADHKTIPIKKGFYVHIVEREQDIFLGVVRQVKD